MNFSRLHIDRDHYYSIGVDEDTGDYLIEVVVTWVAWYSIYFRLLPDEIESFRADPDSLRPLSYKLAEDKGFETFKDRLVLNGCPTRR